MFGFIVGAACLFGLVRVLRHARHGHFGHHGPFGRFRGGFGPRMMLRGLFERLDTTPGQEKVIAAAIAGFATGGLLESLGAALPGGPTGKNFADVHVVARPAR